ncbi:AGAP009939-PA-like protein [Anopheles sinensis]|uniref:AGAP009939-PA-like protein n=1 Tax=Anopheles sinensis TaxID=74873 RepID=A0A084WG25_ANOSI|nr:AGAP009939-PA-like protein [Anopheles sinensis]
MFTINSFEYECTKKCRLVSHGNAITAALTKRAVSDEQLAAYIAKTCRNFAHILDEYGRSALHMAASVGRYAIVEWLINQGASITQKDLESGHTALHRAMYYGSIGSAVALVKHGASLDVPDEDFVNPMQLCSNVSEQRLNDVAGGARGALGPELMIWGQNKNYNLGIGNVQGRKNPESMEYFRKSRTGIGRMAISAYHSVFLTHGQAELYSTGHGLGGRLGLGMEHTVAYPSKVTAPLKAGDRIVDVAAGKHHTLILTDSNNIYSCGENKHCQLGINPPPPKLLTFKEITGQSAISGKTINRIIAKDYHSIAVADADVYVWGLNGGQFGFKRDPALIVLPKAIPLVPESAQAKDGASAVKWDTTVKLVESSNAAIVVYTQSKFLHIFSGFKVKTYKKPLMEKIECLSVTGGELQTTRDDVTRSSGDLRVLVFTASRNIYIWYEDCQQFVRCVFAQSRNLEVDKILWCANNALVLLLGNLYQGTITNKMPCAVRTQHSEYKETYTRKELCETLRSRIELKRIRNLNNVVDFVCDADGENYGALVENTRRCFCVPELVESNYDYGTLLADASEMDAVHDVVLYVEGQPFASHRFILYHRSEFLRAILQKQPKEKEFHLKDHGLGLMTVGGFQLALRFLYTNKLVSVADVEKLARKPGNRSAAPVKPTGAEMNQMCTKLKGMFEQMQLEALSKSLKNLLADPPIEPFPKLRHDSYPELYDLTIELQGRESLPAHKCVLVARLEYFAMMFAHTWTEKRKTADLKTVPREYMDVIVAFLYDNDYERVRGQRYSENFLFSMIIICDQFFIEELKSIFETIICERVQLRNVGELLEFAYQYNCEVLKHVCMQFISVNFARLLEWHLLDGLEPTVLVQVDRFYKEFFQLSDYRTITPFSDAISDEELEEFVRDFQVDLDEKAEDSKGKGTVTPKGKQTNTPKISRLQQEKRNFEKEAMVYLQRLSFEEAAAEKERKISSSATTTGQGSTPDGKHESPPTDRRPNNESAGSTGNSWQKVASPSVANAEAKRKSALAAALRANEVMKQQSTSQEPSYANLRTVLEKTPTPPHIQPIRSPDEGYESAGNATRSAISLGDFALQKGKLSQKQRKRLSSGSSTEKTLAETVGGGKSSEVSPPAVPDAPVNPWKIVTSPPAATLFKIGESAHDGPVDLGSTTTTTTSTAGGRKQRKSSTNESGGEVENRTVIAANARQLRQRQLSTRSSAGEKDFNEILADERRTKQYYEKIKSKSLVLTQIEERAIEELRAFYNVDQVFDESITVERYRPPLLDDGFNYAVWQYQ